MNLDAIVRKPLLTALLGERRVTRVEVREIPSNRDSEPRDTFIPVLLSGISRMEQRCFSAKTRQSRSC
ncbi:hypothetical protein BDD14_2973 [Edaphobacter modestus]|uniref:Uncharacterized protein n=1 Tax=Edaphobacter modestus TaxID=388466 RepID=A0A4Q7YW92_9BACT|nr:hypothetical protein BDD14_2973 [Edaphobacter modestus]